MQDKTINSALLNLRRQMMRDECEGLHHVEALLVQRGVPLPRVLPRWAPYQAGKGVMAHMALQALRGGPQTALSVSKCIALQRPEISFDKAHRLTATTLTKLKIRGLVTREDRLGGLVQDFGPDGCLWRLAGDA